MKIILLNSPFLVVKEINKALAENPNIQLINITVPEQSSLETTDLIFEKISPHLPAIFFTINDGGLDKEGYFIKKILSSNSYLVNWYHDYPFYYKEYAGKYLEPHFLRLDFVSEYSYVEMMNSKGFKANFLPLATDPDFFKFDPGIKYDRNIAFVGNSTLDLMDKIIDEETAIDIEKNHTLFNRLKDKYNNNINFSVRNYLKFIENEWSDKINISPEKFIFATEWMIGYLYRRDFIAEISNIFKKQITIFGDPYWSKFISHSEISPNACYYDNLSFYYQSSKINLNLNRVQIGTSFTQRHFDTKACGAFLLTEKRLMNNKYFFTRGPDQEIVEFNDFKGCEDKIIYYLKNDKERKEIGLNGRERILKEHTYSNRVVEILSKIKDTWNI